MSKVTFPFCIEIGDDCEEHELNVTVNVTAGSPGSGPTMDHAGGEPAEDPEVEVDGITCATLTGEQLAPYYSSLVDDHRFFNEAIETAESKHARDDG